MSSLRAQSTALVDRVRRDGTRFVFVTQVVNWPRMWRGVDTFDDRAVVELTDRLEADPGCAYGIEEISALTHRRALADSVAICRQLDIALDIAVIDVREPIEALGETARKDLSIDLGDRTDKGNRFGGEFIAGRLHVMN